MVNPGMPYILILIYLSVSLAIQFMAGDFPVTLFSFPVNILLFLLWAGSVIGMWKSRSKSGFVRFMLSPGATYLAIGLFLAFCLAVGVTGFRWLTGTWPFVAFLLYFQTVLAFVILRGWRRPTATGARLGAVRWRFLMLHAGLLLAVGSAFWGAPATETMMVKVFKGVEVSEAVTEDGRISWLEYSMVLDDFNVSLGNDGMPSDYRAQLSIGDENVMLRVNHPYSIRFGEDLYLSGYDTVAGDYCILQIVNEPWRYGALAGIVLMLAGAFLLFVGGPERRNRQSD